MGPSRTPEKAPGETGSPRPTSADRLLVVPARESGEFAVPDATLLSTISADVTALAQQMMALTCQPPSPPAVAEADALLAEARLRLTSLERHSRESPLVKASLAGSRTALVTAARELREHLIRHGWLVDGS